MKDLRAYNFETMRSSTLFCVSFDSEEAVECFTMLKFQNFDFFNYKKMKISKNSLTHICAGGPIKE